MMSQSVNDVRGPAWSTRAGRATLPRPSWAAPERRPAQDITASALLPSRPAPRVGGHLGHPQLSSIAEAVAELARASTPPAVREALLPSSDVRVEPNPLPADLLITDSRELVALRDENERLQAALVASVAREARAHGEALEASESELVDLATAIAERVVGRELACEPGLVTSWAKRGLSALAAAEEVEVHVSPDLARIVDGDLWLQRLGRAPVVDESLPAGSCQLRSKSSLVDTGVRARIAAVLSALDGRSLCE